MRTVRTVLWAVSLMMVVVAWLVAHRPIPARGFRPALSALAKNPVLDPGTSLGGRRAPSFRLVNQFGRPVTLRQFRGRVVVLAFVDSECTTICPLTTAIMTDAVHLLGPDAARRIALVGVDANPDATTVADVRAYSAVHGLLYGWNFLTGSRPALTRVWKAYGIYVNIIRGLIDHTPALYVLDTHGRERTLFLTPMSYAGIDQQAQILAHAIVPWLPGHPRVASHLAYAWIRGESPAARVTVPVLTGSHARAITLGPGRPRLVIFVASWLSQTLPLRDDLADLNVYRSIADREGLPMPIVVDEGPTEPSSRAFLRFLQQRRLTMRVPVVMDATGRLADGYGAPGLPWFVLTGSRGQILWQTGTWLPPSHLAAVVARELRPHGTRAVTAR